MSEIVTLKIDVFNHFQLVWDGDNVTIYQYGPQCPKMEKNCPNYVGKKKIFEGHRWSPIKWDWSDTEPQEPDEDGEIWRTESFTYPGNLNQEGAVICGDDFIFDLLHGDSGE